MTKPAAEIQKRIVPRERSQRVGLSAALELLGRHAHLQVEDDGAQRAEADDHGDQLNLPRGEEELKRFARTQPAEFFFAARASHGIAFAPEHEHHDDDAERERCRAHEQEGVRTERLGDERGNARARHPAQHGAAADEPEQPLGLTRIVDGIGQRPELADQQDREDQSEQVERRCHPFLPGLEQEPEHHEDDDDGALRDGNDPPRRRQRRDLDVALHDDANEDTGDELHVRKVLGAEIRDVFRPRDRLHDVVRGHRQERIGEHQQDGCRLVRPHLSEGPQQPAGKRFAGTLWHCRGA